MGALRCAILRVVRVKMTGSTSKPMPFDPCRCRSIAYSPLHEPAKGSTTPEKYDELTPPHCPPPRFRTSQLKLTHLKGSDVGSDYVRFGSKADMCAAKLMSALANSGHPSQRRQA